jgi:glyoxylase-like metal-dependent hydrolase (beta-lactamase superfamily II)
MNTSETPSWPAELTAGVPRAISPMVRRIVAPNPGMMTGPGTNTYLVGIDEVAVIDPGPDDDGHLDAIIGCGGGRIRWILTTHTHVDHWPLAPRLKERTGAEVLAFRSEEDGLQVDEEIGDGHVVEGTEFRLAALHTPGHASNHLCYLLEADRMLFSGDHIMNGSTVVIGPPDGDMATYLDQLRRLQSMRLRSIAPGHGLVIDDPAAKLDEYLTHRAEREAQVLDALRAAGTTTVAELEAACYPDLKDELHPVAQKTVWAHLRKLGDDGLATTDDRDDVTAAWRAAK